MPRERQELFRNSNIKEKEKIFILAFEGNDTERIYFEELKSSDKFNDGLIYLHLLSRPKDDTNSAPNHVYSKLKKEAKEEFNFNLSDELWMIIDTDRWKNLASIVELCKKQSNMFVAISNPCFEFWLLLHVIDFITISQEDKNDLLTNSRVSNSKNYIDKYLSDIIGGYNKTNPKPERFIPHIEQAIQQSSSLDDGTDVPTKLSTQVYKLVQSLIKSKEE